MKPTIGRTVHFQSYSAPASAYLPAQLTGPRAAIITAVHSDDEVALTVFNPTGMQLQFGVPYSATPKEGHWNWPPREPANRDDTGRFQGGVHTAGGGIQTLENVIPDQVLGEPGPRFHQISADTATTDPRPGDIKAEFPDGTTRYGRPAVSIPSTIVRGKMFK